MSNDTPTEPVRTTDPADPAEPAHPADPAESPTPAAGRRSLRDRLGDRFRRGGGDGSGRTFGLAAVLASGLAALIIGGLGGAALHAAVDGDRGDHSEWAGERHGPGDRGGRHGGPGPGMPGQLPPTTAPEDGDSAG